MLKPRKADVTVRRVVLVWVPSGAEIVVHLSN